MKTEMILLAALLLLFCAAWLLWGPMLRSVLFAAMKLVVTK